METILVYGASGVQGGAVARLLLSKGVKVRTITRQENTAAALKEQGIDAFIGDLSQLETLRDANAGIDKIFLNLPIQYDTELLRHYTANAVEAAKQGNAKLIVVNSNGFLPDEPTDAESLEVKREAMQVVKASGIPTILVKPTLYMENFLIPGLIHNGTLFYPVPTDKPISWISSDDAALYHVYALSHPELAGQTLLASGPEALTGAELAERFTAALGKPVGFHSLNYDDFEASLAPVLGEKHAAGVAGFYRWIGFNIDSLNEQQSKGSANIPDLQLTGLKDWLQQPHIQAILAP